jgi:hypothetical protein
MFAVTSSAAAASSSGSTVDSSAAVGSSPSSAAQAPMTSRASSGVKNVPGTLCATARANNPVARGIAERAATDPPPADCPNTAERADVVAHPLQRGDLVEQAPVGGRALDVREPLDAHAVVEGDQHDAVAREAGAVVLGKAGRADRVGAAVDPHHHRQRRVRARVG